MPICAPKIPPLLAKHRTRTNRLKYIIKVLKINNVVLLLIEAEIWLFFNTKQGNQSTHNLTFWRVRLNIAVVKKTVSKRYGVRVCSLSHPEGKVHAPYYYLCPGRL